jgi:hypothetical protein
LASQTAIQTPEISFYRNKSLNSTLWSMPLCVLVPMSLSRRWKVAPPRHVRLNIRRLGPNRVTGRWSNISRFNHWTARETAGKLHRVPVGVTGYHRMSGILVTNCPLGKRITFNHFSVTIDGNDINGRGERIRTSDLSVPNDRRGKNVSLCLVEGCSHQGISRVFTSLRILYH